MQLSQASYEQKIGNPINKLDIRPGLASDQMSRIKIADSPSLLFHYLFDDWYASYALVAKSEHQYAQRLEQLVSENDCSVLRRCAETMSAQGHVLKASSSFD